jgi:hypothetical protein
MKSRCYNEKSNSYARYGGRGICVCDRWLHSFVNFLSDMGTRPSEKHSIDRIDGDGNYEPGNCRWATQSQQRQNSRRASHWNPQSKYRGITRNRETGKWLAVILIQGKAYRSGPFNRELAAARAYDRLAMRHYGRFARLNFSQPSVDGAGVSAMLASPGDIVCAID